MDVINISWVPTSALVLALLFIFLAQTHNQEPECWAKATFPPLQCQQLREGSQIIRSPWTNGPHHWTRITANLSKTSQESQWDWERLVNGERGNAPKNADPASRPGWRELPSYPQPVLWPSPSPQHSFYQRWQLGGLRRRCSCWVMLESFITFVVLKVELVSQISS